jgi:2',3'-cyclic-nucleotide 2'-phosphodiesterase (5'-nucleotidase family)
MSRKAYKILIVVIILTLITPVTVFGQGNTSVVQITLLHTNDFHGRLQPDSSGRGGSANIAGEINRIEAAVGRENVGIFSLLRRQSLSS